MKKLLTLFVLLCALPLYALTEVVDGIEWNFSLSEEGAILEARDVMKDVANGEVTITGYDGTCSAELVIPATIGEMPVVAIGDGAFSGRDELVSVTIPEGVTSIGEQAFYYCTNLTSVEFPSTLCTIADEAFLGCDNLTAVHLPDTVTEIGVYAFADCDALTSVQLPDQLTSLAEGVFESCGALTSITLPEGVTSIGPEAFANCSSLTKVTFMGVPPQVEANVFANTSMAIIGEYLSAKATAWKAVISNGRWSGLKMVMVRPEAPNNPVPSEEPKILLDVVCENGATGTVSLPKAYKVGKKVTLKATPGKGCVFAGWYLDEACFYPYHTGVDYRNPSLSITVASETLMLWAKFIPASDDALWDIACDPIVVEVGVAVAQSVTIDSGSLPKVTVKGLPKGLKFDAKTLTITGKPTTPGIYTVTFSATNTTIKKPAVTKTVQFRVNNIRSSALPDLDYDGVYSLCVPGSTSYTLDIPTGWTVKGLPAGMKWDAKTQSLSGAPTKPGFYTLTLTKKDGTTTDTATITVEVLPFPTLTLTAIGTGEGTVKGGGDFAANKKVTLKATPAKGSVFAGWFADPEGTTPVVSTVDYRTPSLPYVMTEVDTTLYASFVPAAEDTLITITADLPVEDAGVTLTIPLDVTSYSLPKLTVKNLPKGLKYDAKTLTLTGAVTTPGTYTFTVAGTNTTIKKATDATTATFTLQVLNRNDLIPDSSYDKDGTWTNVAAGELLDGVILHEALVGTTVKGLPKGLKWDAATGTLSGTTWVYGTVTLTFTNKQKETTDITLEIAPPPEPTFSEIGIWDDEMADYILVDRDDEATVSAGVPVEMLFSVKAGIGATPPTVKVTGLPSGLRASQKKQDDTVYVTLKGTTKTIGNVEILVTATDLAKRTFTQLYHLLLTPTE